MQAVKTECHFRSPFKNPLLDNPQQVRHFGYDSPHRIRVRPLNDLIELCKTHAPHDLLMRFRSRYETTVVLNANDRAVSLLCFFRFSHNTFLREKDHLPIVDCRFSFVIVSYSIPALLSVVRKNDN
jgi:hypothetical protein